MSTDPDTNTPCPNTSEPQVLVAAPEIVGDSQNERFTKKKARKVSFPDEDQLVTQYFEPANPWQDVENTSRSQLAAEYLESCRRHNTMAIDSVLHQIRELPETSIGGSSRAPRLTLSECFLRGAAPADALEAVLRKVQFKRLEIVHAAIDDEGAEALFDMIEYYESALVVSLIGDRQFGIRGWQAASRMIKRSAELSELEVAESPLEASHAPVLARALPPHTCRLRALCLQRCDLSGEPLLCLVIALKSNGSVRELRLGDNRLTATDALQIASLLRLNARIQLLDLSNNQIQDAGVAHLAEALALRAAPSPPSPAARAPASSGNDVRGLAFLVLWNNQLTRNCAPHLSKALRSSQSLCVLNIGNNSLGTPCIRALTFGGALLSLGLQGARLTPDTAPAIADLIRAPTKLQRLDLRDNRLGVEGLQCILAAVKQNTVLTQIDLDDPVETSPSADDSSATAAQLTRDIRACCARNEPAASSPSRRVHRKISLTCHTHQVPKQQPTTPSASCVPGSAPAQALCPRAEERRGRLRSPAPSPAGSPVPVQHHSRFSVTRVTPEREAEGGPPARAGGVAAPSRFKVMQVSEPPLIQVHPASNQPRRSSSRFSVTRNYDSVYNQQAPPPSPAPSIGSDSDRPMTPDIRPLTTDLRPNTPDYRTKTPDLRPHTPDLRPDTPDYRPDTPDSRPSTPETRPCTPTVGSAAIISSCPPHAERITPNPHCTPIVGHCTPVVGCNPIDSDIEQNTSNVGPAIWKECLKPANDGPSSQGVGLNTKPEVVSTLHSIEVKPLPETDASKSFKSENKTINNPVVSVNVSSDIKDKDIAKNTNESDRESINKSDSSNDNLVSNSDVYKDRTETLSHSEAVVGDTVKTETKLVKNSTEVSNREKMDVQVEVTVKKECATDKTDQNIFDLRNIDEVINKEETKDDKAMKKIEAITEDLGNLIQEFKDLSTKNVNVKKVRNDCTQTDDDSLDTFNVPVNVIRENLVLKKNKSESSLDSPDLEVSRLMNKKLEGSPFCDSSSSLEISGSSVESLNTFDNQQNQVKPIIVSSVQCDTELDRRKTEIVLSTESSIETTTSEITPVNSNLLNMSVSSNESVSPIIFGKGKKIHDSLSSLEASVSSLDSGRHEKVMVTSADSGIEYSLQQPPEIKDDNSSNEGTLTNYSSLKETVKKDFQETITSPKRTSSLLDVPALKTKAISDRMRKISWVAPSPSFHIAKPEPEKEMKLPSHLEKLLSLFQHPLFSRSSNEEEKKSASNTPPRKDSSLTSSFWSWGSSTEKEKEDDKDRDSSSEATDSTLSERVQVCYVDESFSKKLDSKTPSTDTDNTLSEFQTFQNSEMSEPSQDRVTTDDNVVQKSLVLSKVDSASSNGNTAGTSDNTDLRKPNDMNKNFDVSPAGDNNKNDDEKTEEIKEPVRPRSFAAVLKSSGSENSIEKQSSPDLGQSVDKLSSKVIRGIKENISPENTLTSSMTNTKTLALELTEKQVNNQQIVNTVWEITVPKTEPKTEEVKTQSELAPIATIEETCDEGDNSVLDFIDDPKFDEKNTSTDSGVTSLEGASYEKKFDKVINSLTKELEHVDLGKDALSYLIYENQDFASKPEQKPPQGSLAQELQDAEIKEMLDLSPELIIDEAIELPEVFTAKEIKGLKTSPVIPERAKIKKANSLEELSQEKDSPKAKTIVFKVPEISTTTPRDIPERRSRLRTRSGSSPKSLPESLNKPCPLLKMDSILNKKKKKVSSLGKMAKDSLLALNMSEDEIAEFRRSYKLTSVESLRSLESVSEDANSQSGNSIDSRCKACLRMSQESLMSLDSISEDCRCTEDCEKPGHSNR